MASGSINLTSNQSYVTGRIDWQSYANNAGNYSDINVQVYVFLNGWGIQGTGAGQWKENGNTVNTFSPYINIPYGGYGTVQVFTKNGIKVNHNDNGDGSITLGCDMQFNFAGITNLGGSQTIYMDHIDRYPYFTRLDVEKITMNTATIRWQANDAIEETTYNVNNGSAITGQYPTFTIEDLEPNTYYNVKVNIKRKSNGLWASQNISFTTLDYAKILEINDMDIESSQTITYKVNPNIEGTVKFEAYCTTTYGQEKIFETDLLNNNNSFNFELTEDNKNIVYFNTPLSNKSEITCELTTTTSENIYKDTKKINFTFSNINPIINDFDYEEKDVTCFDLTGGIKFIKNYSDIEVGFTEDDYQVQKFSSGLIKNYHLSKVRIECGNKYEEQPFTGAMVGNKFVYQVEDINGTTLTLKIYDTRGNMGQLSKTIELIDYNEIKINEFTAERNNGVSTVVTLNLEGTIDLVDFGEKTNRLNKIEYRKRKINEEYIDDWTNIIAFASTNTQTGIYSITDREISGFQLGQEYEIQIRVTDKLSEAISTVIINTGEPLVCFNRTEKIVGIGKIPDTSLNEGSVDVAGDIAIDGENFLKKVYPIGSIYLSINSTNPSVYFGGSWQQIAQGRTLVGVNTSDSDFNTAQKTGGEKTHKLTVNEIPAHTHVVKYDVSPGSQRAYLQGTQSIFTGSAQTTESTGGNQAHNNLQPYFTCYIWKRTA